MHYLLIFAIAYTGICLVFYVLQDLFFFRPEKLPFDFSFNYVFPFEEVHFHMEDGAYLNGLHFRVPNAKGVIFYVKGNSRSIKGWAKFARDFVSKGYDFFMVDFRGFGKSRGRRTEANLYNDLQQVYQWLENRYPEDRIVIYGRSLGSGLATRIASWNHPRMLILDCPYYSFLYHIRQFVWFLPLGLLLKYKIRTDQFVQKVICPIFIIHGRKDRLLPFKQGLKLHRLVPGKTVFIPIEGASHNNLPEFPEYHHWLYDILNEDGLFERMLLKADREKLIGA